MMISGPRSSRLLAAAAALSMVATPAFADRGWGGGWGGGHHRGHDDTGAWVVGGIIGIGMIAAIASAASKSQRDRQARKGDYRDDDDYRRDDYRRDENRYGSREDQPSGSWSASPRGIDGAVDRCVDEVERGSTRVESVDNAARDANGWRVSGRVNGGQSFDCTVDGQGRIRGVSIDGRAPN